MHVDAIVNILDSIPCAHACTRFVFKVHVHIIGLFQVMDVHLAEESLNIFALSYKRSRPNYFFVGEMLPPDKLVILHI